MGDAQYINRLVDWIADHAESKTAAAMIRSDLEYLGQRLDAIQNAGHKGAHAEVDRFAASRFITGTYLLLGDILRLKGSSKPAVENVAPMTRPAIALEAIPPAEDHGEAGG
jgi:hypothetical protein